MESNNNGSSCNFNEDTELRLGLPGTNTKKRSFLQVNEESTSTSKDCLDHHLSPPTKVQAIGWPPVRSYMKNRLQVTKYVKVSMDGAPYLRKIDLKQYKDYNDLLCAFEQMFKFKAFSGASGSDYKPTYEDKDGDWMLVGDVPWDMFIASCKRLRLIKGSSQS
ncbi:unnamed protein product [Amaranthus hypochondriacus]